MNSFGDNKKIIVHLGAGQCSEILAFREQNPAKIVLVEANPTLVKKLKELLADSPEVLILESAVAEQPGKVSLQVYNLPWASGICSSSRLPEYFPGLKVLRHYSLEAETVLSVLARIPELESGHENLLVVDLPGIELPVLRSLVEAKKIHFFDQLVVHTSDIALYNGEANAERVRVLLAENYYDLDESSEFYHISSIRGALSFSLNKTSYKNAEIEKALGAARVTIEELTRRCDEQSHLAATRQEKIEELATARDEQSRLVQERLEQIEELTRRCDEQTHQATALQEKVDELAKARDEQSKKAEHWKGVAAQKEDALMQREDQSTEIAQRQTLMDEEFIKAEAQLELIKDIILREKAF